MTDPWEAQREALGSFIHAQRKMANLSLRQLAELTSLSNPYLSQLERGLHQPSVRVLKLISDALNVSAETLLTEAGLITPASPEQAETGSASPPTEDAMTGVPLARASMTGSPAASETTGRIAARAPLTSPARSAIGRPGA